MLRWPRLILLLFVINLTQSTRPLLATEIVHLPGLQVFVFLDTECPISQKIAPRLQALATIYSRRVSFTAVFPAQYVSHKDINQFKQNFSLKIGSRIDATHWLVNQYHITTTPEVLLISDRGLVLYRGAVDNQFYKLGKYRVNPTEFYLRDAIEAVLDGRQVSINQVTPVGCLINRLDTVR